MGAAGQIPFCAVCVSVFVCLGKYDSHNIYVHYVVKTPLQFEVSYTQFFCSLLPSFSCQKMCISSRINTL